MSLRGATPKRPEPALVVFARAPDPGRVKTRLVPLLGEEGAARLHARLVTRAVATAIAARIGSVELHCTGRMKHPFFVELAARHELQIRSQGKGDLGERMYRAFKRALRAAPCAILIGSD